ncbi:MAG: methyltransferase [Leptotrichiaceae bacterium]|nr:methyltransferase [Leptotrichiaceae bacterium]
MDKIKLNQVNIKKFYDEICNKYDYIFPLNEIQKKFMDNEIKGNRILDVGSSTGNLSKYLIENGINVTSIDINEKLIFKAAQKGVEVKKLNMLEIDTLNKFDTIINIGNTLPHLNNKKEIYTFLEKAYDRLEENGKLIIQIINFNKFIINRDKNNYLGSLPLIENENVKFERNYYLDKNNNIIFKTILDDKIKNEEILLNINFEDLKNYLEKIGIKRLKYYGGFDKSFFDFENSVYLIITGEK